MRNNTIVLQNLNDGWVFQYDQNDSWVNAKVPGNIHLDLYENDLIPDPFFGQNESKLQWIADRDWIYKIFFRPTEQMFLRKNIQIFFKGIDTYADVYMNDVKIISASNMFHPWSAEIRSIIKKEENEIVVHFRSALKEKSSVIESLDYSLPADNDQAGKTSPFTRKAPFHFGWDWGPCFVTSGLWRDVELLGWDNWHASQACITNKAVSKESAELWVELEISSDTEENALITIDESRTGQRVEHHQMIKSGYNKLGFPFIMENPDLWWPIGHGSQPIHEFSLEIKMGVHSQVLEKKIGIRDVFIKRVLDDRGQSFEVHVNGKPIYSKGANWIPADSFVERLTKADYERLLSDAVRANMNTLRIWGGGIYEPDHFYELCDEMGIMVWQDFMFACSLYPAEEDFLASVEKEAKYQLDRIKSHACIILWCGNNEVASGWLSWGWKEELPQSVWNDYEKLFHELLPTICKDHDPTRLYWPSSPGHAIEQPDEDQIYGKGDNHYWGVWHGGDGFDAFEDNIGRFMSEYGMQSFPDLRTIESFTNKEDRRLDSDVMNAHQKASLGTGNLMKYVEEHYRSNGKFESVAVLSQVMQAQAIRSAVESHRRNMPYCMGTLYWQFNDCWPAISWSSIDHGGNWKALHYLAKIFFSPILVSIVEIKGFIEFHVVNDQHEKYGSALLIELYKLDGSVIFKKSLQMEIDPFSSNTAYKIERKKLANGHAPSELYLKAELSVNESMACRNDFLFVKPKKLAIQVPDFQYAVNKIDGRFQIVIRANSFLFQLHFRSRNVSGFFSDNFFDVLPNEEVVVEFEPSQDSFGHPEFEIETLYELMN